MPKNSAYLKRDAGNRTLRAFLTGLVIDVLVGVTLVLLTYFVDKNSWGDIEWAILGFSLFKSLLQAAGAFVLRRFLDPSRFPTPIPPADPGEPDDDTGVAANYWNRNIRFIYDPDQKGNPVTWVEDFDPALQKITLEELLDTLGEADRFVEAEGDYYVTYLLNNGHEITFVLNVPMEGQTSTVYLYYVTEHTP